MGVIERYSLTTTATAVDLSRASRVLIRVSGDSVRVGYDNQDVGDTVANYFTIPDGIMIVLDPPNEVNALLYFRADSGTATLEVWKQGALY
jgi:hypothetical protein